MAPVLDASPRATRATSEAAQPATALLATCAVVLIGAGIACVFWMYHPTPPPPLRRWDLGDLAVYRAAGEALVHGHSVYGAYVHDQLRVPLPFIYPPVAALLATPFTALGETPANLLWTAATVVWLGIVVKLCFAPLLRRYTGRASVVAFVLALLAMMALSPVEEHLRFGQVGIPLMACCVIDCMLPRTRWPRGLLIGVATAFKLVPGIFIPYLALTRRWKAAGVATATFLALTLLGALIAPSDSWHFFTDKMFEPTSPTFFTNQSLQGILQRALGDPWRLAWVPIAAVAVGFGVWRAVVASLAGNELLGVALTGLVGVLVSPISWIHHLVWVIPAIAVIVGRGDSKRRILLAFVIAGLFVARLPYVGFNQLHSDGIAPWLEDSYGLLCLGLLLYLADPIPLVRGALANRAASRAGARTPATAAAPRR
jgi:alpha-1,2-mannosyltransferase